jgi:alginate O-acetyltransferase complex protein AlgI
MALGCARMMNFDLPVNFNSPYQALCVRDFWKRWHITLTRFLTRYIYIPLGGSRKGTLRTCANIMIIFLISGFWHGAAWTFIIWGAYYGILMITERLIGEKLNIVPAPVRWLITFVIVMTGWVFFRADSMNDAVTFLGRMYSFRGAGLSSGFYASFGLDYVPFVTRHLNYVVPALFILTLAGLVFGRNIYNKKYRPTVARALITVVLFTVSVTFISEATTFIYFKF